MGVKNFIVIAAVFLGLLIAWETASYYNRHLMFVIPPPSLVFIRLWEKSDRFIFHTLITTKEMLWGFSVAFLIAFPLAWLMDLFKSARAIFQPLFIVIQCVPMFTLAPIMIIWFGWNTMAIIVPTALMIFFPLTISIYQGLRSTPQDLLDYFKVNQATPWQIFSKLKLPWSLPHIFAGFRLSAAIAGIAAVAGEWAGAQEGLGVLMLESRRDTDLETNFGALFCLTFISSFLYFFAVGCEYLSKRRRLLNQIVGMITSKSVLRTASSIIVLIIGIITIGFQYHQYASVTPVRLTLDWLPNPNHITLYVGMEKEFFKNHGIDLKLQKLHDSGHATTYVTSGQSDLAVTYMPHTIRTIHKGAKIKPIAILIQEPLNSIIYRKDETLGIHQTQDLNGKKLGFCTGSKDTATLDAFLSENHITLNTKQNVGFDLVPYLGTQQVDAIYGAYWNIETEHLRSLGIETAFFKLKEFGVPTYHELIIVGKEETDFVSPEFIERFQAAMQEAIEYAKKNPKEAFDIYVKQQPDKSAKTQEWEWKAWLSTIGSLPDHQTISKETWNTFESWLKERKLL